MSNKSANQKYDLVRSAKMSGFTLLELVLVIMLLGILAAGLGGLLTLTTQSYINISARDALLANARFAVERLNREIRNAVPNSVRVVNFQNFIQCIEFVPIIASSTYVDIPVLPEPKQSTIDVVPFQGQDGVNDYACENNCGDQIIIYPLTSGEVYAVSDVAVAGKVFTVNNFNEGFVQDTSWQLPIVIGATVGVHFLQDSPTRRFYLANEVISYCVAGGQLSRYNNSTIAGTQKLPPQSRPYPMAENLAALDVNDLPFTIINATLQRNALVKVRLHFSQNNENYVFDHDIQINNVP